MSAEAVLTETRGAILVITINRPKVRNAVNLEVAQGLAAALDQLTGDPALQVGILTGAGGYFSAGMDLKAAAAGEKVYVEGKGGLGFVSANTDKPLIAAVEGFALGGGFELALACDLVVAGKSVKFGFPEVSRGLIPGAGGVVRLPRQVPYHKALEFLLTGGSTSSEEFARLGLVNKLTEDGEALSGAIELAERISANAPLALAAVKRVVRETANSPEPEAFAVMESAIDALRNTHDFAEGAKAFLEKRAPHWSGN